MNQRARISSVVAVGLVTLLLSGCTGDSAKGRPKMGKVRGTVTYKGKPVSKAVVTFFIEKSPRSATGTTDDNGNFKLTTYDTNDGAFLGTHKVTVVKPISGPLAKDPSTLTPDDLMQLTREGKVQEGVIDQGEVPKIYGEMSTTPLKFTVEAGENEKLIVLEG